jgi:hypothetical protein
MKQDFDSTTLSGHARHIVQPRSISGFPFDHFYPITILTGCDARYPLFMPRCLQSGNRVLCALWPHFQDVPRRRDVPDIKVEQFVYHPFEFLLISDAGEANQNHRQYDVRERLRRQLQLREHGVSGLHPMRKASSLLTLSRKASKPDLLNENIKLQSNARYQPF